jgi:hypothetical protein
MFGMHMFIHAVIVGLIWIRKYGLENQLLKFDCNHFLRYSCTFHRLQGSEQFFYDGQEYDVCTDMKEVKRYTFLKWNAGV